MNKRRAIEAFDSYVGNYDTNDVNIKLKINHTYRVADLAEQIGRSAGADPDFSWFLGLLHDIGRMEQFTQFRTFIDRYSVDHAELGADILFRGDLIDSFPSDAFEIPGLPQVESDNRKLAETAIRLHNKLTLPDDLDQITLLYCRILRDADKCDIMRVITEPPYDERNNNIIREAANGSIPPARSEVMDCVYRHRCVPRVFDRTDFEGLISQCCMCFELEFPVSRSIVSGQGYLDSLMNLDVEDECLKKQLADLRKEIKKAWEMRD